MLRGSRGLMDRALDLKPEVTQGCGFKFRLWQEESTTELRPLGKAPNPQLLPGRRNAGVTGQKKKRNKKFSVNGVKMLVLVKMFVLLKQMLFYVHCLFK